MTKKTPRQGKTNNAPEENIKKYTPIYKKVFVTIKDQKNVQDNYDNRTDTNVIQ